MYKAIKENKIIAVNDSGKFPCLIFDEIIEDSEHEVTDFVMVSSEFVLSDDEKAVEEKKKEVRAIRNSYLEETDKYVSIPDFPISEEEKENYKTYRTYLRDYTELENWWEANPKTFEEWKAE